MSDRYNTIPVGFRRLNKEPLDYYEKFSSLTSAINYAKGDTPHYDGQRIFVAFDSKHVQEYMVKNNRLVPILPGGQELITQRPDSNKWVLIYYNNTSNTYNNEADTGNSLLDPYQYSILNNLELFRMRNNTFDFRCINNNTTDRWQQSLNPVIATDSSSKFKKVNNTSGYYAYNSTVICPKISNNAIVSLYVNATEYLSEVGL